MKRGNWKKAAGISAGLGVAFAAPAAANAATITVDSLADPAEMGKITLRDAITAANGDPGSLILFDSAITGAGAGAIVLGSSLPTATTDMTIRGPGASRLTISGQDAHQILKVQGNGNVLAIEGLTLTNGFAATGGALATANSGKLEVRESEITSSSAINGGAIGLSDYSGLTVERSTISGNSASDGGGIFADQSGVVLDRVTMTGNSAGYVGGALAQDDSVMDPSPVTVSQSTISGNTAAGGNGGLYGNGPAGFFNVYSTILAGNTAGTYNTSHFLAYHSVVPAAVAGNGPNNLTSDPLLKPLAANGGETRTMLPSFNSPVIDQGISDPLTDLTDQRGSARIFDVPSIPNATALPSSGPATDIGAVELTLGEATPPPQPPPPPPKPTFDLKAALKKCKKKKSKTAKKKCKKKARQRAKAAAAAGATIV